MLTSMRWCRTSCMQARRCALRLQSRKTQRRGTNRERMEQHAHLPRFLRGAPLPLAVVAQRAGATTADAGCIHHTQASIGFSALLVRHKRLMSRTAQGPIRLEGEVLPGEAASFPGCSNCGLAIARGGRLLRLSLGHSSRKLGGAHLCRLKLMPQFQAHVPNPWRDDLPGFLGSRASDYTSGRDLARRLHLLAPAQRPHDADRAPPHRRR